MQYASLAQRKSMRLLSARSKVRILYGVRSKRERIYAMEITDVKTPITADTLRILSGMWKFTIHGDFVVTEPSTLAGLTAWDLEFQNMHTAVSFADVILGDVVNVDIRQDDCVRSLYSSVVLTIICPDN